MDNEARLALMASVGKVSFGHVSNAHPLTFGIELLVQIWVGFVQPFFALLLCASKLAVLPAVKSEAVRAFEHVGKAVPLAVVCKLHTIQ